MKIIANEMPPASFNSQALLGHYVEEEDREPLMLVSWWLGWRTQLRMPISERYPKYTNLDHVELTIAQFLNGLSCNKYR